MKIAWICLLCAVSAASQVGGWDTYVNHRFEYLVEWPVALVKAEREATNGDGREFKAKAGKGVVAVYGTYVNDTYSAADRAKTTLEECADAKAAYVLTKPDLQAVSCVAKTGDVLYYKALVKKDRLAAVEAHYPSSEKGQWDAVVARMGKSLHLADVDDN